MSVIEERVWAGSEASYSAALTAETGANERMASNPNDDEDDDKKEHNTREQR